MKRLLASLRSALGRITSRATPRPPLDFSDPHANPCPTCGGYPGQCGQCGSPARPPQPKPAPDPYTWLRPLNMHHAASPFDSYPATDGSRLARHINEARHGKIVGNYAEIERRIAAHALDSQDPFAAIVHEAQDRAAREPQSIDEMYAAAAARFLKSPPLRQHAVLRAYEQALQRSLARRMLARSRFLRYLGRRTQEPPP